MLWTDVSECTHAGHETVPWDSLVQVGALQGVINMVRGSDSTSGSGNTRMILNT